MRPRQAGDGCAAGQIFAIAIPPAPRVLGAAEARADAFVLSPARTLRDPRHLLTTLHAPDFHSRESAEAALALLRSWPDRNPIMTGDLSGVDFTPGRAYVLARRLECMPEDLTHLHAWVKRLDARTAFDMGGRT